MMQGVQQALPAAQPVTPATRAPASAGIHAAAPLAGALHWRHR